MNQPPYGSPPGWGPPAPPGPPAGPPGYGPPQGYGQPQPFGAPPGYGPPGYGPPGYGPPGFRPPPKKSNVGLIIAIVIGVMVVGFGSLVGLGFYIAKNEKKAAETTRTVRATDDKSEIEVPSNWSNHPSLNEDAVVQVGNERNDEFLIVITEPKVDFEPGFTVDRYADLALDAMKKKGTIRDLKVGKRTKLKIDSRDAVRNEVEGIFNVLSVSYAITFIDGDKSFHQIMVWAPRSRFESRKSEYEDTVSTFRER